MGKKHFFKNLIKNSKLSGLIQFLKIISIFKSMEFLINIKILNSHTLCKKIQYRSCRVFRLFLNWFAKWRFQNGSNQESLWHVGKTFRDQNRSYGSSWLWLWEFQKLGWKSKRNCTSKSTKLIHQGKLLNTFVFRSLVTISSANAKSKRQQV